MTDRNEVRSNRSRAGLGWLGNSVAITAVAVVALALPGLASAARLPQWHLNGQPLIEFESVAASGEGKIALTEKEPVIGDLTIECSVTYKGSAAASSAGEITALTATGCTGISVAGKEYNCASTKAAPTTMEAVHLPWRTELVTVEKTTRERIVSGGSGTPGFKWSCHQLGVALKQECVGTLGARVTNTESGVTTAFEPSEKLVCNPGSAEGWVEGSQKVVATGGDKLTAATDEGEWYKNASPLTGATPVSWAGTVELSDDLHSLGEAHVRCEDSGTGEAGSEYKGEMTKWTFSNCTGSGVCEVAGATIEALHLPWNTELATVEKTIRNYMVSSGKGAPYFLMQCKGVGMTIKNECRVQHSTAMANSGLDVTATYNRAEQVVCVGEPAGELESTQTIGLSLGGQLEVNI
jgi:hypothetical protein